MDVVSRPYNYHTRYNVLRVERIQNPHLWLKFTQSRDRFLALGQDLNEMSVYHGTSDTEPRHIYTGIEGLDFRLAREGLTGRGNYFSREILLANEYAYKVPRSNYRQIILFKILTGKIC